MITKDLDLFKAYNSGPEKTAGKNNLIMPLIIIAVFVFLVGAAFGTLYLVQSNVKSQIKGIREELKGKEYVEAANKLGSEEKKNEYMRTYKSALDIAKKNFDKSRIIDRKLLEDINTSLPSGVTVLSININPQNVQLICESADMLSPALLTDNLTAKSIFGSITYDGITKNEENNLFSFTMNCIF